MLDEGLAVIHLSRLGFALNYSVCLQQVQSKLDDACKMASASCEDAVAYEDNTQEDLCKDSMVRDVPARKSGSLS